MAYALVSYPNLDTEHASWIEAIRAEHDPLSKDIIAAHITLVFPVENITETVFIDHVTEVTQVTPSIDFVMRCAVLSAHDDDHNCTHVFLIPDEGHSRIVKLHDQLYGGPLKTQLRLDIPYIPHIGVGNDADPKTCKLLADELNRKNFEIAGRIEWLDILQIGNNCFNTIKRVRLQL